MKKLLSTITLGIVITTTGNVNANTPTLIEESKIFALDGAAMDGYGTSVSIDGDTALIGAPNDDDLGDASGSAYVYIKNSSGSWSLQQKLIPSDGAADDKFGDVVYIQGDTAIIGRDSWNWELTKIGSAYVFTRNSEGLWTEQQKLTAYDEAPGDMFGNSLALSGDTLVISAIGDDDGGLSSGSAYIFARDSSGTWNFNQKITSTTPAELDTFGTALAVDTDTIAVAASGYDYSETVTNSGIVYIFSRDSSGNWTQQQTLLPAPDDVSGKIFGKSLAMNGDYLVIGADFDDQVADNAGAAYIYQRDVNGIWSQHQKLLASDGVLGDYFGHSVDIDGDKLAIGAYGVDDNALQGGAAYTFILDTNGVWNEQYKLLSSDAVDYDYLSIGPTAIGISGDTIIAGAEVGDTAVGVSTGSAYIFDTAQAEGPSLSLSTTAVSFADVLLGDYAQDIVTVSNVGTADLNISSISVSSGIDFSQTNDCPLTLLPGTACQVTISFTPTIVGALTDTLTILSDDPSQPSVDVALSGTGINQLPDLTVSSINSPDRLPAGGYETISVTITNQGEADIDGGYYVHLYLDDIELAMTWLSDTPTAGQSVEYSWFVSVPMLPNMRNNHTLKATVDILDDILESDETNNETTKSVTIH